MDLGAAVLAACWKLVYPATSGPVATLDAAVRDRALVALHALRPTNAYRMRDVLALCIALRDPDLGALCELYLRSTLQARWELSQALRHAPDGVARTVRLMSDPDQQLRHLATLNASSFDPDPAIRAVLLERLADPDAHVQRAAMGSLVRYIDPEVEAALLPHLPADEAIRSLAKGTAALPQIFELARSGNHAAVEALTKLPLAATIEAVLVDAVHHAAWPLTAWVAADHLSQHGSSMVIPALEYFLDERASTLNKRWRKEARGVLPPRIFKLRGY